MDGDAAVLDADVAQDLHAAGARVERDDDSGTDQEADTRFNVTQAGTYTAVVTSFDIFDDERLAMVYQEETETGERSFFSEFVSRDEL